jgi:hypothetical protein
LEEAPLESYFVGFLAFAFPVAASSTLFISLRTERRPVRPNPIGSRMQAEDLRDLIGA